MRLKIVQKEAKLLHRLWRVRHKDRKDSISKRHTIAFFLDFSIELLKIKKCGYLIHWLKFPVVANNMIENILYRDASHIFSLPTDSK